MAPLQYSSSCHQPMQFRPQMMFNRDFWLHALTLPSALVQRLFATDSQTSLRTSFHLPAERCPHLRTLMSWPDATYNENPDDLFLVRQEVASIANAVAKYEPVWMYASAQNIDNAKSFVSQNVTVVHITVDHPWLRDTGPVLVTDSTDSSSLTGIDFNFNFWGGNGLIRASTDRTLAERLLKRNEIQQISASIRTEGGALEVDGEGTLLATESSLLNPNRNGDRSNAGMEDTFRELLGVQKTIWLEGVNGIDAKDYHIDRLARFGPNSNTVLLSRPHSSLSHSDPRYLAYEQARFVLSYSTNAGGYPFTVVEIEEAATIPRAEPETSGDELLQDSGLATPSYRRYIADEQAPFVPETSTSPATHATDVEGTEPSAIATRNEKRDAKPQAAATSYVNFYLLNGAVIVPQFGEYRTDEAAVKTMKELFPDRVIETVMLNWMPFAGGGPHSSTLQWPKGCSC